MGRATDSQHIIMWGTYDASKPRAAIIVETLAAIPHLHVSQIHSSVWRHKTKDVSVLSFGNYMHFLWRLLCAYPSLIVRYLRAPRSSHVLILYPGWLDVIMLWPFAALRGTPIVFDMFISLYDTSVNDRQLVKNRALQYDIKIFEKFVCKLANTIILDTRTHCDYVAELLGISRQKYDYVFVGSKDFFRPAEIETLASDAASVRHILFYGAMIPLHGIALIVDAALLAAQDDMHWHIIGSGQHDRFIKNKIHSQHTHICYTPRVAHEDLPAIISSADICLGIFGRSDKAHNVVPHKIYECLAMGKNIITMNSKAIQEIYPQAQGNLLLLDQPSAASLYAAIKDLASKPRNPCKPVVFRAQLVEQWKNILQLKAY